MEVLKTMRKVQRLLFVGLWVGIFSITSAYAAQQPDGSGDNSGAPAAGLSDKKPDFPGAAADSRKTEKKSAPEYALKAALIHILLPYVYWPDNAAVSNKDSISICVLGKIDNEQLDDFQGFFESKPIKAWKPTRNIVFIKSFKSEIDACHVVFIAQSESARLAEILNMLEGRNLLTISDIRGFANRGGMVEFLVKDEKVKFIVNRTAAKAASLRMGVEMLERAIDIIG